MSNKITTLLTREAIIAAADITDEIVEVPEWGGAVKVRGMSVADRTALLEKIIDEKTEKIDPEKATLVAFIVGVVEPKFTEADFPALRQKSAAALDRVTAAFLKLSGIDTKALASARKNSRGRAMEASRSRSPKTSG